MTIVALPAWEPDVAGLNVAVLQKARNVYPTPKGYGPVPSLSPFSSGALPAKCVGKCYARTSSGSYVIFAGTAAKLYKYSAGAWADVSRLAGGAYAVPDGEYWSFAQFGTKLIAVNTADVVQSIDVDSGTNFAALAGSPPKARYVFVVGDFVVLAALATNQRMLRNSAINDTTGWTVGTNLCDEQEFPDGGRIVGVAGGEFGYIVQEGCVRRMIFQPGSSIAFRFERAVEDRGGAGGYAVTATASTVFFLSEEGFFQFNEAGLQSIGAQRVNKWFRANSDTSRIFQVYGFRDPLAPRVLWAFFGTEASQVFDRLIIYDYQLNRWSYAEVSAQFWATVASPSMTLEELDVYGSLEDVPASLDSRSWEGGSPSLAGIDPDGILSFLEGAPPLPATLTLAPAQMGGSMRGKVTDIFPMGIFDDATVQVRIGKQEHTGLPVVWGDWTGVSSRTGWARPIASSRVHTLEFSISDALWEHMQGFDAVVVPDGLR